MKNSLQKLLSFAGTLILALGGFTAPFTQAQQTPPIKIGFSMGFTVSWPGRQRGRTRYGNLAQ